MKRKGKRISEKKEQIKYGKKDKEKRSWREWRRIAGGGKKKRKSEGQEERKRSENMERDCGRKKERKMEE